MSSEQLPDWHPQSAKTLEGLRISQIMEGAKVAGFHIAHSKNGRAVLLDPGGAAVSGFCKLPLDAWHEWLQATGQWDVEGRESP